MKKNWLKGMISAALVAVIAISVMACGGDSGSSSSSASKSTREQIEDCMDPWDGNHRGFEDQIRPLLNDEDSMRTHETTFGLEPGQVDGSPSEVVIRMVYSAENRLGGRIKKEALGYLNFRTCAVRVIFTGLE